MDILKEKEKLEFTGANDSEFDIDVENMDEKTMAILEGVINGMYHFMWYIIPPLPPIRITYQRISPQHQLIFLFHTQHIKQKNDIKQYFDEMEHDKTEDSDMEHEKMEDAEMEHDKMEDAEMEHDDNIENGEMEDEKEKDSSTSISKKG